ncbi:MULTISPECIES: strawberry notch-like NTP hydrolase domain-containing protein [Cupriavidus]
MTTMKWMDLSEIGVYFGSYRNGQTTGLSVVDMTGAFAQEIAALGFEPVESAYGRDVYAKPNFRLTPAQLAEAFGRDKLRWVQGPRDVIDRNFRAKVKEKTAATAQAMYAQARAVGMNDRDEVVYDSPAGRFVQREMEGKRTVLRDDGLDRATFLHARTTDDLRRVARGFVRRIVLRNHNFRREHVKALMALSNDGGFDEREYQEAIETEANVLLQEQAGKHLARGWDTMGVFDIANRIYLGLPKLATRSASSIAYQQYSTTLPLAILAQAMLAPRDALAGRSILDPTVGNASLVTTFNAGRPDDQRCRIFGVEIDEDRVASARDFADKVVQGDATEAAFRALFAEPEGFDYVIANPPFGSMDAARNVRLPDGSAAEDMTVRRLDHYILLESLHARRDNGRAVFITGADGAVGDGAVEGRSKHLLAYLMDHYHIDGVVDVSGDLYKKQGAAYPLRLYVIGARRQEPIEAEVPERLPVLHSYDALREWAQRIIARRDNPLVAPEPRVLSLEESAQVRREMHRHTGVVDVARYLAAQARTVSPAQHRFAVDGKVLALDVPVPNADTTYATQAVFWWEERNPRIAMRSFDGRFMVVSLQRKRGEYAEVSPLEVGEAAERRFLNAFDKLTLAEASVEATASTSKEIAPAQVEGASGPAASPHYVFSENEHARWHQRDLQRQHVLDDQMQRVVEAVRRARDKHFYKDDVRKAVLEELGDFFRPEDLTRGTDRVEGGDVGMALFYARDVVLEQQRDAALAAAHAELGLAVGLPLGTLIFNSDFKVNTNAVVTAIDGQSVRVEAKRGAYKVMFTTDALAIQHAIERAIERGKRKPAAPVPVAADAAGVPAPAANANANANALEAADPEIGPEIDLDEALRTFEVDVADLRSVAEALAKGVHPATGKPIPSEGMRKDLVTELEQLVGSVQSAREARPDDEALGRAVEEAVALAARALAASEPVAPQGAELKTPAQADAVPAASAAAPDVPPRAAQGAAPWAMTRAEWNAALAALGQQVIRGRHPGKAEAARLGEKVRLYDDVSRWYHERAKAGDAHAREWIGDGFTRIDHEDVVRKALVEGQPVPAHVLAAYPDLIDALQLAPVPDPATAALQARADTLRGVVAEAAPFADLPAGWLVMNAPRPLVGDRLANGDFRHGRFYAAIDPAGAMATLYFERNARDDARMLFTADAATRVAMALQTVEPEYHAGYLEFDEAEREEALHHHIASLNDGRSLGELRALAAKGLPVVAAVAPELPDVLAGESAARTTDAVSVLVSANTQAGSALVAETIALASRTANREAFRDAMMEAFSRAVDSERAALYAHLQLQRGVTRGALLGALDTLWDGIERAPVAQASAEDPNLGRKWASAAGEVEIMGYWRGNPDQYQTLLNGKALGAPLVERDTLEERVALDARQAEDMAKRRAAQAEREAQDAGEQAAAQDVDGFGEDLSPQRRGKIVATLDKTYTFNGRPGKLREQIRRMVAEGHRITRAPDGTRRLSNAEGQFLDERDLLKTGMDYAAHLLARKAAPMAQAGGVAPAVVEADEPASPLGDAPSGADVSAMQGGAQTDDALEGSLDELLAPEGLPEGGEFAEDGREENEFQQPYVPYSNIGEPSMMIPANLSGPVYAALAQVKARYGDIDEYVSRALQFEVSDLERMEMKPEQIDALALIFAAHDQNLGFLLADKMGAGKGRVIALVARRERLNGRIPVFVTVTDNLFTDFLERDVVAVESRELFKNPLIINDGAKTTDANGNVVVRSLKREEYRRHAEAGELPPGTDIVLMTYAQVSRRPVNHLTSRYMIQLAEHYPISLLLDESHNGAGASNTGDNLNAMISLITRRGGKVLYSSGTPIKGAKNLKLYSSILPKGINTEELLEAVASDPLSLQEALNFEIAARGCLISRELDSSNVVKEFHMSPRRERNLAIADQLATILAAMAYLSGDVHKIVRDINRDLAKELQAIPESEREGSRMGATSMNFGSRLHALTGQLLLALKMPDVLDLAVKALQENVKPIVALRRTGESLLGEYLDELGPEHESDATRRQKDLGTVTLERPVTFRDYMHRTLQRLLVIKVTTRYGEVSTRLAASKEIAGVTERLEAMIDALPDDLPLTPIDYLREGLAQHGFSLAEVSGRNLRARTMENGKVAIEPVPGRTDKTRINRAVRDFNNGEPNADVIVLTASGSTGISLHASPATGRDLRARRMIKAEMQQDITAERQMDGRHDRTGSVQRPEYAVPLTGLPADDRLAMMFNNANRSLTSSTVANRDSRELIKTVPDLLNVVGDEVAYMMLRADPALADRLDIHLPEDGEGWMKGPLWYVKSLTGHMALLRSDEQFALYEELQARFTERLDQLKAEGRNPLEVVCHDWRARVVQRDVYMGEASAPVNAAAAASMFNKPVYLTALEYEHEMKAVRAAEIDERLLKLDGLDHGKGAARVMIASLRVRREALLQQATGKKFDSVAAALAAPPDKDGKHNETRKLADKLDWLERNLAVLGRGSLFYERDLAGEPQAQVVMWYALPQKPEEFSRPSSFIVYTLQPGTDVVSTRTLSSLHAEGIDFEPQAFADHVEAREAFDRAENGIVTRRVRVLDGNLFEATALNLREHMGRKIVYTDDTGNRQHGIMVHSSVSTEMLLSLSERLRDPALIAKLIEHQPVGTNSSGKVAMDDRFAVIVYRDRQGEYVLRVPGSTTRGGQYFLDPVLSLIKGKEAENHYGLDFKPSNGGMRAVIAPQRLQAVVAYLIEQHNVNFFIRDRTLLRTVRQELANQAQPVELAA